MKLFYALFAFVVAQEAVPSVVPAQVQVAQVQPLHANDTAQAEQETNQIEQEPVTQLPVQTAIVDDRVDEQAAQETDQVAQEPVDQMAAHLEDAQVGQETDQTHRRR